MHGAWFPVAVFAAALFWVVPARAECAQVDLAGTWALVGSNGGSWSRCYLVIDEDGAFGGTQGEKCFGTRRPAAGHRIAPGGLLELVEPARCRFEGSWTIRRVEQAIDLTLNVDGDSATGIVRYGDPDQDLGLHFGMERIGPQRAQAAIAQHVSAL